MEESAADYCPTVKDNDIVISGFSGHFPQADHVVEFKEKLYAHVDFITNNEARWPKGFHGIPERMGTIRDLSRFDAQMFGVNPKQAHLMDPQVRLLLETSYEAIMDAGYDPETLRSHNIGVFIGCSMSDSDEAFSVDTDKIDGYGLIGSSRALFSNRISYAFDFTGPSVTVDTACSSTLSALNHAVLAIRSGQCEAAIVGGCMVSLKPATSISFSRLGMLSPDGKCKSFDAQADGFARSETVGVFFVQQARHARRIYTKVAHIKISADGYKSEGISTPSAKLQERLIREVYTEAKIHPKHVLYVEAHGTGTKVGDPPELAAVSRVFCDPKRTQPLKVGSVKSNLGHSEAAAGVSSLAKVILAMETGVIARNLHFQQPNPDIPSLLDGTIEIVDKATPFPGGPVGVNNFGFGGTNAHVILEQVPGLDGNASVRDKKEVPRLVLLAGRTKDSLEKTIDCIEKEGPYPDSGYALLNMVGQRSAAQFPYRGYMLVPVDGSGKEVVKATMETLSMKRPVWFVFTGVGCQWKGMAQQMMQFDVFARSIQNSHEVLKQHDIDLIKMVTSENLDGGVGPLYGCLAAVEVALVDVLLALGIRPDGMVGHSLGEIGCAYSDGCLTAEQTVLCAYMRGRCVDTGDLPPGAMAAVGLTWEEATKRCPEGVQPACHNAENSVTVSGAAEAVVKWVEELKAEGVFVREVNSAGVPFHSKYMESITPAFLKATEKIVPQPKMRSKRWLSTSLPPNRWREALAEKFTPEYHMNNLVSPVYFFEALQHVPKDAILLEIAPHCLLQSVIRRSVGANASCLGLMKRDADNVSFFLNTLGHLHSLGVKLDPSPLYPPVRLPVPRGTPNIGHLVSWDHSQQWTVAKWNEFPTSAQLSEEVVEVGLEDLEENAYLAGHKIHGRIVFPATGYIMMAWKSLAKRFGKPFDEIPVILEDLKFHRVVILPKTGTMRYLVNIMRASGEFEISEGGTRVASGNIRMAEENEKNLGLGSLTSSTETLNYELDAEDIYKDLRLRGFEYHGAFVGIHKADMYTPCGKLTWSGNWVAFIDTMLQITLLYNTKRNLKLPTKIQSCIIDPSAHASFAEKAEANGIQVVYDECLNVVQAGGVVVKGLNASTPTMRVLDHTLVINEYSFVPYVDSEVTQQDRQAVIQEYIDVCNSVAGRALKKLSSIHCSLLELPEQDSLLQENWSQMTLDNNPENHGLLEVLGRVAEHIETFPSSLEEFTRSLLSTHFNELESDVVMTALFQEDPLRHILDVVVENTSLKSLLVLEIASPGAETFLTSRVSSFITMSNMLLNVDYTIAQHPTENRLLENVPVNAKIVKWDPMSDTIEQLPKAHLALACFGPWRSYSPDILADKLPELCKEQGFALIYHRTAMTPAESFLSAVAKHEFKVHTTEEMERLLRSQGLQLVARKSNNVSTLLLVRKMAVTIETANPILIGVNNARYDWVEVLKMKAFEVEQKPPGHNLWLIAEDCAISGVVGLTNCLRLETGGSRIRCLFNASIDKSEKIDFSPRNPSYRDIVTKDLVMNIYRDGQWGSFRQTCPSKSGTPKIATKYACINVERTGDLSSLQWYVSSLSYAFPSASSTKEVCTVYYAALNFRDIMLATGTLSSDALPLDILTSDSLLGMEFAGLNRLGQRVMGIVPTKGLATAVAVDRTLLWDVPETWSLQQAASVPMVYATAYYALLVHGRMRPGESVLIHSGAGGVGQAAISIALSMGCTVLTTVGVDLVLNSLAEDKLQASVCCLRNHGRFLEIGKADLFNDSPLKMSVFLKGVTFHGVVFELLHSDDSNAVEERSRIADFIRSGIASGAVRPLDTVLFPCGEVEDAFRFMTSGKHIGKIVLEIKPEESLQACGAPTPLVVEATARTWFYEHKSYVITGGLGGFGLELAEWIVNRGCRKLLLTTRSGVRTGYQRLCLHRFRKAGANVIVRKIDASEEGGAQKVFEEATAMGPVGGIFILAVELRDGLIENQTAEAFETVFKIKIDGTRNLDRFSRKMCPELDHFIAFSSLASGVGNVGQTNYGYANSALERVCELRAAQGLPGIAIQWGAIADVGAFHEKMGDDATIAGTVPQRISSCIALMDQFLNQNHPVVSSCVKADPTTEVSKNKGGIVEVIAQILGMKDSSRLNPTTSLSELGMDSLMAVEVRQAIERHVSLTLSMKEIRQLTIEALRKLGESTEAKKRT
ncbi:fatty acid synthase-like isoform X2 [Rhipicephalus microplus]|uniref:fatty acid synthase-like isoform X2 n=1 Tax=Rhipicephalus microplus TaxID=6941 RepID=UPI003F6A6FB9